MLLPFAGNLRAAIPGLVSMLLHPLATHLRALASKHAAWDRPPLQQRGSTPPLDIHTLEPELACKTPRISTSNYLVPRCRVLVRHLSDKRTKNFWFAQESRGCCRADVTTSGVGCPGAAAG